MGKQLGTFDMDSKKDTRLMILFRDMLSGPALAT
jgi:hypothetical protein